MDKLNKINGINEPIFYFLVIIFKDIRAALGLAISARSVSCEIVNKNAFLRLPQ